jgi:hypothetical protein
VEIDKRFVEYLLELSDSVTPPVIECFGAPLFRVSPTNIRKWAPTTAICGSPYALSHDRRS